MYRKPQFIEVSKTKLTPQDAGNLLASFRRRGLKQCEACGKEFEGFIHQRFCSARCQRRAYARKVRQQKLLEAQQSKEAVGATPTAEREVVLCVF